MSNAESNAGDSSAEEKVQYKKVGKVGYLTLNNPTKMNAIDQSMVGRILEILKEVDKSTQVNCLVIRSVGERAFTAGWDLSMFQSVSQESIDFLLNVGSTISRTIFFMKKPVIAQIQGPAVGMGTIMALAADFRIVAKNERAFFQLPELDIGPGIPPATGPTVGAVAVLGIAHAKDMLLTGRKVSLEEFDRWGAVTQIVDPPEDLPNVVKRFARNVSKKNSQLLDLTKTMINIMGLRNASECWELENEMARWHFAGMMGQSTQDEDSFIKDLWKKYGHGCP